jgi:hypothetical protein
MRRAVIALNTTRGVQAMGIFVGLAYSAPSISTSWGEVYCSAADLLTLDAAIDHCYGRSLSSRTSAKFAASGKEKRRLTVSPAARLSAGADRRARVQRSHALPTMRHSGSRTARA